MGLTLPPMPPMPAGARLDSFGSVTSLPGLPSLPEQQPPWAVQMWVDLTDLVGVIARAATSGDTEALAHVAADERLLLFVPVMLAATAIGKSIADAPELPYPALTYDQQSARRHYRVRPGAVAARALEIGWRSAGFGASLGRDYLKGAEYMESNAPMRAEQLTQLLTELGPTFIKLGQSASIRSDLLPPAYCAGLQRLQDKVPAFDEAAARAVIERELPSVRIAEAFKGGLPSEPVAAASLGQVYRVTLADGSSCALKVQRPNMEDTIALDMHLLRDYAAPFASALGVPGELAATADAWGAGFVDELDYALEATNAEKFTADIAGSDLESVVFAPKVIPHLSTRRVLATEWVEGERLDVCPADDVPRLCSVAMVAYLRMMLDTGTLHCDPHPGNLLRTPTGKLCILDWGLVTGIDPELQLSLIEHVAHLTAQDYAKVPGDLVKLGFVPKGGEAAMASSGIADFLTYTYSTWTSGGGASKFNVPQLLDEVRGLAAKSDGGIFQVPPYFAYIAKAFSVLEGIGLGIDPNYSIVKETLPYISTRIITDPSPRTAGALATFVYGEAKDDEATRVLDADRIETLLEGVKSYAGTVPAQGGEPAAEGAAAASGGGLNAAAGAPSVGGVDAEVAAEALVSLLLSPEPSTLQDIVIEQTALVLAAGTREAFAGLRSRGPSLPSIGGGGGGGGRSLLGALVDPFGIFRNSPLVRNDARDESALAAARKLATIASELLATDGSGPNAITPADARQLAPILARKVWARRDALPVVSRRLLVKVVEQTEARLGASVSERNTERKS